MASSSGESGGKTGSEELGRLIRERREELGLTRQELADMAGLPYPTVAQIETAYRGVSPTRLKVIADVLKLDGAGLFDALTTAPRPEASRTQPRRARPLASKAQEGWLANPNYDRSRDHVPETSISSSLSGLTSDQAVVDRAIALLSALPADEQLDALARVQSGLLAGLIQEEVLRATDPHAKD